MAKGEATVGELIDMIRRREIELPEMQRRYVWKSTKVRDLMDSLYRGYPSGAILLWDTDEQVETQGFAVGQESSGIHKSKLLLDGQQRLTSLSAVLLGEPISVRGRRRPIELLFNLDHPENLVEVTEVDDDESEELASMSLDDNEQLEDDDSTDNLALSDIQLQLESMTFIVKNSKMASLPNWIDVSAVFANDDNVELIRRAGVTSMDDPRFKKYNDRLNRLRKVKQYTYRLDILERTLSYEEVAEIFVRVNSLGVKLRGSDLALAQVTARWRGSLAIFQEYSDICTTQGFRLDTGHHLRTAVSIASSQCKFKVVSNLKTDDIKDAWTKTIRSTDFALNFMKANCGITSPALLSSPLMVTAIAYFANKRDFVISPEEAAELRRYILIANAKGRYSRSSSESVLDQDLGILRDGGGIPLLFDRLVSQVGRIDIQPGDLIGRNQRSSLFKMMFIAFKSKGAQDWKNSVEISLDHGGQQDSLQFHHIFPKAFLKGIVPAREIDDLANLAFISATTNNWIRAKSPETYIPQFVSDHGTTMFDNQCIPLDGNLLGRDSYNDFLAERRIRIAAELNRFLGIHTSVITS
jgi:hypothetical protein